MQPTTYHPARMFFRQVLHEDLGCASYVVADGGEAAVIDPKWEIEDYLRLAEEHDFGVSHVLETHNHADHVSGKGGLAQAAGATIHVPADGRRRVSARAACRRRPRHGRERLHHRAGHAGAPARAHRVPSSRTRVAARSRGSSSRATPLLRRRRRPT